MTERRYARRLGATVTVALAAVVAFAVIGGTGLAGGLAKPFKAQYGPGQYAGKVTVCHKGWVTIRISVNAWPAHRDRHGDSMGPCSASAVKAGKLRAAKLKAAKLKIEHAKGAGKAAAKAAKEEKHAGANSPQTPTVDEAEGDVTASRTHGNGRGKSGKNG